VPAVEGTDGPGGHRLESVELAVQGHDGVPVGQLAGIGLDERVEG
jgi:hypothetical protein